MRSFKEISTEALGKLMEQLIEITAIEIEQQGHNNTGKLIDEMRYTIEEQGSVTSLKLWLNDYYLFIEYPMGPGRVPFTRGSGAKASDLVKGLMKWFASKGVSDPGATFATINTWKKEGRPTRASYRFSKNGRRTGFLEQSVKEFSKDLNSKLAEVYREATEEYVVSIFRRNPGYKISA